MGMVNLLSSAEWAKEMSVSMMAVMMFVELVMKTAYKAKSKSCCGCRAEKPANPLKNSLQNAIVSDLYIVIMVYSCVRTEILRPCQNSSRRKWQNYWMLKSANEAAWLPSRPRMPTPTWLDWIMLMSLAPSPMARVLQLSSPKVERTHLTN